MNSKSAFISDFNKEQNSQKPLLIDEIHSGKGIPCTFAEINDLTHQIHVKNINFNQPKYALSRGTHDSAAGNCSCYKQVQPLAFAAHL